LVNRSDSSHVSVQYPPGTGVMVAPVMAVQMVQPDRAAGGRGVHEAALSAVDADAIDLPAAAEDHQVAGGQLLRGHLRAPDLRQLAGGSAQAKVRRVPARV